MKPASTLADSLIKYRLELNHFFQFIDSYNTELARKAYRSLAKDNLYVTPTMHYIRILVQLEKQKIDHSTDSLLSYLSPVLQEIHKRDLQSRNIQNEQYAQNLSRLMDHFKGMLEPVHNAGINLLAGTDSGTFSAYIIPGQSLHEELKLFVDAGLTPAEALRSSVINGPKFFNQLDSYGGIEKGKTADLLLLRNNPLQNIEHSTSIQSVVARRKFYSKKELNILLNSIKN